MIDSLLQDLRYAARTLTKNPGFTITAIITLALGIGANSAIFSVVNGVLFKRLPYRDVDRLVTVYGMDVEGRFGVSELERARYRQENRLFASVGAYTTGSSNLTGDFDAERVAAGFVNANLFSLLGASPQIGRTFTDEEDAPGNSVAILSHELWQRRFAGDQDVLGQTLTVNSLSRTIVGVMPPSFRLPTGLQGNRSAVFLPLALNPTPDPRNFHYLNLLARLADGISLAAVRTEMTSVSQQLEEEIGTLPPTFQAAMVPVREDIFGNIRPTLFMLLGSVMLVLLIACVNVANLLLARAEARMREISIRTALGAGRLRVTRQLLTESLLLGLAGGALGLLLASWVVQAVVVLNPPGLPRIDEIGVDLRVVGFTVGIALLTSLIFGLAPVLHMRMENPQEALRDGGWGPTVGVGRQRLRRYLVVAEIALGLMLAVGAGLLSRSYARLLAVDLGFRSERVMTMQLSLPSRDYADAPTARRFYTDLLRRVEDLPGVLAVGGVTQLPLASRPGDWGVRIAGREEERLPSGGRPFADWMVVTDGYFEALGVELAEGRYLDQRDDETGIPVVMINATMARHYWPDGSALGARFKMSSNIDTVYRTVVGIVVDVRHNSLDAVARPQMYLPHAQFPATANFPVGALTLAVQTSGAPASATPGIRRVVSDIDRNVPISNLRTMQQVVADARSVRQINVILFTAFGVLGLVLVAVGVYGVMAYTVSQRTRELGIRMAIGATPPDVQRMIVKQGLVLALLGIATGLVGALLASRALASMLFGVSARDPVTFVSISLLLAVVSAAACYLPARQATTVDPVIALRDA